MIDLKNRNYINSVKCIGSIGKTILPILLISEVNILHKWCLYNDLNGHVVIGITITGYADDTALELFQYFINHI